MVYENVLEMLQEIGRIELTDLATIFFPSQPVRLWEENSGGDTCEEDAVEEEAEDHEWNAGAW